MSWVCCATCFTRNRQQIEPVEFEPYSQFTLPDATQLDGRVASRRGLCKLAISFRGVIVVRTGVFLQVEGGGGGEVTAWISALHTACAASLARHLNRDSAIRLLQSKMRQLEISIDLVRCPWLVSRPSI